MKVPLHPPGFPRLNSRPRTSLPGKRSLPSPVFAYISGKEFFPDIFLPTMILKPVISAVPGSAGPLSLPRSGEAILYGSRHGSPASGQDGCKHFFQDMQIIQDTQKASVHQPRNPANEQTLFFQFRNLITRLQFKRGKRLRRYSRSGAL